MRQRFVSWLVVSVATMLLGCSGGGAECVSSNDCFSGEVCVDGTCGDPVSSEDGGMSTDMGSVDDASDPTADSGSNSNTTDGGGGGGGDAAGSADTGGSDGGSGDSCVVDPFEACTDDAEDSSDPNDTWADAYAFADGSVGCKDSTSPDTIFALDQAQTGRKCHLETGDWYRLTVVPCDSKTLRMEVRLDPDESHLACTTDLAVLGLKYGGGDLDCNGDRYSIDCSTDGDQTIVRMLLPPANTVHSFQMGAIQPDGRNDVQYDYRLQVTVAE